MPRGGARAGAGRPKQAQVVEIGSIRSPRRFLEAVMANDKADLAHRIRCALALLQDGRERERSVTFEEIPLGDELT